MPFTFIPAAKRSSSPPWVILTSSRLVPGCLEAGDILGIQISAATACAKQIRPRILGRIWVSESCVEGLAAPGLACA